MLSTVSPSMPDRFLDRTLDSFVITPQTAKAHAAATRFANGEIRSLVLSGATGVGKTHLAAAAATRRAELSEETWARDAALEREARADEIANLPPWEKYRSRIPRPVSVTWLNVAEAITDLRREIGRPVDSDEESTAEYLAGLRQNPCLLVLDDLGREKASDWTGEAIYVVVNARYESKLPTIVTTNLTGAELAASPYWPVISRLAEDGELVRIEAPDHRLKGNVR